MTELSRLEQLTFGPDAMRHPITGMILEQGLGALPPDGPDGQARRVHLPEIFRTQGAAAADAMRIKLDAAERNREILKG